MKNLLRKWLGITDIETVIVSNYSDLVDRIRDVARDTRPMLEDKAPRLFAKDEDVTHLVDSIWLVLAGDSVRFGVRILDDQLSGAHGGPLYIIPGEEVQEAITFTGYDWFTVGACRISTGNKAPDHRIVSGTTTWQRLPGEHPLAGQSAIRMTAPDIESYKQGRTDYIKERPVELAVDSRFDVPWHAHYGYVIEGVVPVTVI